jgi:phosphate transport system substrate-binding protein
MTVRKVFIALFAVAGSVGAAVAQVQGAGSTLADDLIGRWASAYGQTVGGVKYQSVGSSTGVRLATEQTVDFGVTDIPLTNAALKEANLRQVPLAASAVAFVVNIPGYTGKSIRLSGEILADIYRGDISNWNAPLIASLNPGAKLPNVAITPLWRSDGSGQSYLVSRYMSRYSAAWRRSVGSTNTLKLKAGKGLKSDELKAAVKSTAGAIASMEFALTAGLPVVELQNLDGGYVAPSAKAVSDALQLAKWDSESNSADLDGSKGASVYPISTVTYGLLPTTLKAGQRNAAPFLAQSIAAGDRAAIESRFVPLPEVAKTLAGAATRP